MENNFSKEDEERMQELADKAIRRFMDYAVWTDVLEYLHEDDRTEYDELYKRSIEGFTGK